MSQLLAQADAWVEPGLGQVDCDVGDHYEHGADQHGPHDERDVVMADGIVGQLADAGPGEDALDDDDAAQEVAEIQADLRDDRANRVTQGMAEDNRTPAQAFGSSSPNIVG